MKKELKDFYKEINDGKFRGSRKVIADAIGIDVTSVSKWTSGVTKPSEDNIKKIAKKFNKSQEEIEKLFSNNLNKNDNKLDMTRELELRNDLIDFLKEENKKLKDKNTLLEDKIKSLESKLNGKNNKV